MNQHIMPDTVQNNGNAPYRTLIVASPDMVGRLVGRRLPFTEPLNLADSGVDVCSSILALDTEHLPVDGLSLTGFQTGWHDLQIIPKNSLLRPMGWLNQTAIVIGDIYDQTGKLVPVAPRAILREQSQLLENLGWRATVATELEFYLLKDANDVSLSKMHRNYSAINPATNSMEPLFDEVRDALMSSGIQVESWQSEWGSGQWEMNLAYGSPMNVADSHTLFKMATKDVALRHGYKAVFMAKPTSMQVGSSCHIHVSLRDQSNTAAFFDKSAPHNISDLARFAMGGILRYTPYFMPLYASNINSYRRLVAGEFCGCGPSWGFDNRTVTCRVIGHREESLRLEFRIPGADVNPYLAIAGVLASIRKGILDQVEPGQPISGDAGKKVTEQYPMSLESATEKFIDSADAKDEFGEDFVLHYGAHLHREIDQFRSAVTDWEIDRYIEIV